MTLSLVQERRTGSFPLLHDGLCCHLDFQSSESPRTPREQVSGARPTSFDATNIRDQWGAAALSLDGATGELQYPDRPTLRSPSTAFTLYGRVKFASLTPGGAVFGKDIGATWYSWGIEIDASFCVCYLWNGTGQSAGAAVPGGGAMLDQWISLFCRWTTGTAVWVEAYYDGGRVAMTRSTGGTVSGTLAYDARDLLVGTTTGGSHTAMDISQMATWNRKISDAEMFLLVTDPGVLRRRTNLSLAPLVAAPADISHQPLRLSRKASSQ